MAPPAGDSIEALFEHFGPAYRWLSTGTCMMGAMTVVLSMTTVNVAFPDIMGAFSIGRDQAQLLSSGYFAAMTTGMVLAAWLISIFGERVTYAATLVLFILGSSLSGIATSSEALNFGRLMQGMAAGVIQPLTMAVTFKVFPPGRRGTAMGIYSMGIVFAPAIGPTLGGIAIDLFNWRYIFFLTLPPALLAALAGMVFMPTKRIERRLPNFDYTGFALLCCALFALMLAFSSGQREGWSSDYILSMFTTGAIATLLFIIREHYAAEPLLNMRIFRYPSFSASAVIACFSGCVFLTSTFLIPVFVQQIQSYTPLRSGLLLMPGGLALLVLFPLAGRIADTVPPHLLIGFGLLSYIVAFTLLSGADAHTSFWVFVFWTMFIRIGLAFTTPVVNTAALRSVPPDLVNQASGGINLMRQLGAAFGMNCTVAFLEVRIPFHGDAFTAIQAAAGAASRDTLVLIRHALAESGVADAFLGSGSLHYLGQIIHAQASTSGFQDAFTALGVLALLGLLPVCVLAGVNRPARSRGPGGKR